jgi:hypothetical protein
LPESPSTSSDIFEHMPPRETLLPPPDIVPRHKRINTCRVAMSKVHPHSISKILCFGLLTTIRFPPVLYRHCRQQIARMRGAIPHACLASFPNNTYRKCR